MKEIDKHIIRDILDEMHIASSYDEDGDLMIVQQADEDFVYDVVIYILVNDNRLSFLGAPYRSGARWPYTHGVQLSAG